VAALSGEVRERTCAALGLAWRWAKLFFARGRLAYRRLVDNRLKGADGEVASVARIFLSFAVPVWEEMMHTPAVFVRVANKGVAGYGEWKIL
jgi:hypothetical protein